jgi:hypothetical protein
MRIEIISAYWFYLTGKKNKYKFDKINFLFDWVVRRGISVPEASKSHDFLTKYKI